jgi:hypothetical protein
LKTGAGAQPRSLADVSADAAKAQGDLTSIVEQLSNIEEAKNEVPKVQQIFDHLASLASEVGTAWPNATDDARQKFNDKSNEGVAKLLAAKLELVKRLPNTPPEFTRAIDDGELKVTQAIQDARNAAAGKAAETQGSKLPQNSPWMMWVLAVLVIAACVGFLYRDGIWSNVVRLVNMVFAGLLAMNFYEPLANFAATYQEDLHTFTAFWDFLAFWVCFIGFMAVFTALTDSISRVRVRFLQIAERYGAPLVALCIGWVATCIVFTSMHLAPLGEYPLLGTFQPQTKMFFGMFAPDREWLGFTKYQSLNGFSRSAKVSDDFFLKHVAFSDFGDDNFIDKNWKRRIEIEKYVAGNLEHSIRVNKQFITAPSTPAH